jgi:hypothetical protein
MLLRFLLRFLLRDNMRDKMRDNLFLFSEDKFQLRNKYFFNVH